MNEFDDEALVAYLDGELDAEQTQKIDQQIATHPDLRDRIHQLRMTWDLLEELPVDPPSPRFAETTLEMAALSSAVQPKTTLSLLFNNPIRVVIVAIPLLFLGGFIVSRINQSRLERQLLRDLPILVDWRSLSNIDSLEWLEVLAGEPGLVTAFKDAELGLVGDGEVPIPLNGRRAWVKKLDDADRGRLSVSLREFQQRAPSRQAELRKIIESIYADPATKLKYLAAARSYELLLQKQSMTQRSSLFDLPLADRKSELLHLISTYMAEQFAKKIPPADATAIEGWAEKMQLKYTIVHGHYDALKDVNMDLHANLAGCEIRMSDFEELASGLSPEARNILHGLHSNEAYVDTLVYWIRALTYPNEASGERISTEKIKELYMKLSGSQQDQIDLLQSEQAKSSLRKLNKPRAAIQASES
jgi:hypothetical protein